jgi:hypothetical protein
MHDNHLTACNTNFGRIGRKFPEHFLEKAAGFSPQAAGQSPSRRDASTAACYAPQSDSRSNSKTTRTQNFAPDANRTIARTQNAASLQLHSTLNGNDLRQNVTPPGRTRTQIPGTLY